MKRRRKPGFTLIELMIVVAIIGVLAAIAVPKFAELLTKSHEASVKGALGAVRSALSIYYSDSEGHYPSNLFVGLTTGNKYLPPLQGQASLGRFEIPSNRNSNPGHTTGYYHNATAEAAVYYDVDGTNGVTPQDPGTEALVYMATAPFVGDVCVNCTHHDSRNNDWTTY
jgi:prepilin-type N-terminal cleavage/methylation domain-containing protein